MGVGHKVESLAYFIALGFASGLASFTGQNIGAGRFDRVWKGTVISIKIIFVFTLIYSIATIVWAPELVMLFNNDPAIVHHGTDYIRIVLIAETLQAVLIILEDGAFSGAGFTRPSFTLSLPVILARIPLAWLLAIGLGMGATGVWLTIAITMAVNSLIFIRIMLKKGWMETAVA